MKERVLVTGGAFTGGLAAARGLAAAGYRVWATVSARPSYAARSRAVEGTVAVPDPSVHPRDFVAAVAAAVARHEIRVVLPGTESAMLGLSAHRDLFSGETAVGVPPSQLLDRATDKAVLAELAAAAGLRTPETIEVSREETAAAAARLGFPVVVKPTRSTGAAVRVEAAAGLGEALSELHGERFLVQPFLSGRLVATSGVAWEGECFAVVHQAARRIWPPECGISSFAETIAPAADRDRGVRELIGDLGWSGLFQLQSLESGGADYAIDLNPRIYGSLALAIAAGANLPALWVELLLGRRPEPLPAYRVGVRYRAEENDVRALSRAALHGSPLAALRGALPRRGTTHGVFSWRDPGPSLTTLGKLVRRG